MADLQIPTNQTTEGTINAPSALIKRSEPQIMVEELATPKAAIERFPPLSPNFDQNKTRQPKTPKSPIKHHMRYYAKD